VGVLETTVPNIRWLLRTITSIHRAFYLGSEGRIGGRLLWIRFLLLNHTGRKSGVEHHTPLLFVQDRERFIVAASNGGDERDPQWWLNLQNRSEASVWIERRRIRVCARAAESEEAKALWPMLTKSFRFYPAYQKRTRREIPIVILEPVGESIKNPAIAEVPRAAAG
jgi:deazaflavin-dependent oxidoreductase (nitroreductase family)